MKPQDWRVTFDVMTQESAEKGDAASRGFITEGATLRDAIAALDVDTGSLECVEADSHPICAARPPRWISAYWREEGWGARDDVLSETRSLHIPERVTGPSRMRLARLLRCYGA